MGERLYRDEVGAAVERLAQLEEENARLRAELERVAPSRRAAGRTRAAALVMVALAALLSLAGLGLRSGCPRSRAARPQAAPPAGMELRAIRGGDDCSLPYFYDRNGQKRLRPSCLGLADPGRGF